MDNLKRVAVNLFLQNDASKRDSYYWYVAWRVRPFYVCYVISASTMSDALLAVKFCTGSYTVTQLSWFELRTLTGCEIPKGKTNPMMAQGSINVVAKLKCVIFKYME